MLAMKTYKPKKPVYKEIENVQELCRLCLEKAQEGVAIFKDGQDVCAVVAMRIMICVGLEMKHEQSLPNVICKTCYEELENYYKFRRKCQMSYQKLKYHILAMKLKHQNVKINATTEILPVNETVEDCGPDNVKEDVKIDDKEFLQQSYEQHSQVIENVMDKAVEIAEVQIPIQAPVNPDISTFLSTILTELGILSQEHGLLKHQGVSILELETGDEEQLLMELVEEDEDTPVNVLEDRAGQECVEPDEMVIDVKRHPTTRRSKTSCAWCSACARAFSSRSALTRHERGHAGARPHACSACGASFAQKAVLHRHMLVHLDVRPHRCSQCSKSFTQRSALEAHARTHAAPHARPLALHRCTACDKVFLYASGLSRHMVSHNGRVYECATCDKTFKDRSSFVRHLKNVCHKPRAHNTMDTTTVDSTTEPALED